MTLVKNKAGGYEADIRDRTMKRLHVSLDTKKHALAMPRHTAVEQLVREGHADLVDLLRRRKLNVAAIERCAREKRPFDTLRARDAWPTVDDAIDGYVGWLEAHPNKAERTASTAASQLEQFRAFVLEHPDLGKGARLDHVTGAHFTVFQNGMATRYAQNSLSAYLSRAGAVYRWAQLREDRQAREQKRMPRILHSPIDSETLPGSRTNRTRFLSEAEAERLLAATPPSMLFPVACGLLAGLRIEEMLHLRPPPFDINLERGLIIVQARDGWQPKNGKMRHVPIADDLRPILERHLARYASERWVYPSLKSPALPFADNTFRQHFKRVVENAGLVSGRTTDEGVVYHTLRHTFASWLVMRGVDLYSVSQLLGNSLKMVELVYAHIAPDFQLAAMGKLAGAVSVRLPLDEQTPEPAI